MRAIAVSIIFFVFAFTNSFAILSAAEPGAPVKNQPLSDQDVNSALDKILAAQKNLTRLQAKIFSRKSGGVFSGEGAKSWGEASIQVPDLLLFVDYGDKGANNDLPAYVLIDGSYLWDMKPADGNVYEVERIDMKNASSNDLSIASLLIGAEVGDSAELRKYYQVSGSRETYADGGVSYHFTVVTLPGKSKNDKDETNEIWVRDGQVIPWYLRSTSKTKKTDVFTGETTYKNSTSDKEISDVRTNFTNPPLAPFNVVDKFYIGILLRKHRGAKVLDKGALIPNAQLTADLKVLLSRLQQKQQAN